MHTHTKSSCGHDGVWDNAIFLFLVGFNCIFQLYCLWFPLLWYGHRYHMTLWIGQLHPTSLQDCFLDVCRFGVGCHYAFLLLIPRKLAIQSCWLRLLSRCYVRCYVFWFTHLGFLKPGSFCSATTYLQGVSLNMRLNLLPSDSIMSCLESLYGYHFFFKCVFPITLFHRGIPGF